MISILKNTRFIVITVCFIIAALIIISINSKDDDELFLFDKIIIEIFSPFQQAIKFTARGFTNIWSNYIFLVNLKEENKNLQRIIEELKEKNLQMRESQIGNLRLRKLLNFKEKIRQQMIPAEVVGWDPSTWYNTIVIDKGKKHGITNKMPVVVSEGIVGRIMEVSRSTSKVLLAIDHRSSIDAIVQRSRAKGVIIGMIDQKCQLKYVIRADDVQPGDEIVSSGMGGVFPKGLLLGRVSNIKKDSFGMFQFVEVSPVVNFTRLEEVFIIIEENRPQYDN